MVMDSRRQMEYHTLICSVCGGKQYIPRQKHRKREHRHIKDEWCYRCKEVRKFIEYRETDLMRM